MADRPPSIIDDMRAAADLMLAPPAEGDDPFISAASAITLAIAAGVTPEAFETKLKGEPGFVAEVMRLYRREWTISRGGSPA